MNEFWSAESEREGLMVPPRACRQGCATSADHLFPPYHRGGDFVNEASALRGVPADVAASDGRGTVLFELMSAGCDLRIDLALGSNQHLHRPLLELMGLILSAPAPPAPPPPAVEPVPSAPVVVADPPEPEPPPPDPGPVERLVAFRDTAPGPPATEPVTFSVDEPEEPDEPVPAATVAPVREHSPSAEVLAVLADAGGEISDPAGLVTSKIADLTGLASTAVSSAVGKLKAQGLVMAVTSGRRTSSVTLTLSGWEAAGEHGPVAASRDRLRDRASGGAR